MAEIIDKGSALKVIRDENNVNYYDKLDSSGNPILFAKVLNGRLLISTPNPDTIVETFHFAENDDNLFDVTNPDFESFDDLLDKVIIMLGNVSPTNPGLNLKTGIYTGNDTISQPIIGVGFTPKYLRIWRQETLNGVNAIVFETTTTIIDDNINGMAINNIENKPESVSDAIISLDSDGFTVDDGGTNNHPNASGTIYNYMAIG